MFDRKSLLAPYEAKIDTAALAMLIRAGVDVVLLDARGRESYEAKRIPGAKNVPADSAPKDIAKAIPSKDSLIVTYCGNVHCPASKMLYERLKELGYQNVLEYQDGIAGWLAGGYPAEEGKKGA